jgi:hypothetical protein
LATVSVVIARREELEVSLARQLGLNGENKNLLVVAGTRWQEWQRAHPALQVGGDLHELREWMRHAGGEDANTVLLALAELGAVDGGDDPAATAVLLWLLLPGAVGVARALMPLSGRIDELVAAQLWICARTVSWRKGVTVAATVLMNTRREVMTDLGLSSDAKASRAELPSADLEVLSSRGRSAHVHAVDVPSAAVAQGNREELHDLFIAATKAGVVTADDCRLLVRLAEQADTRRSGRGRGGLLGRDSATDVARECGLSRATVARRADRALRALQHTYAEKARCA